MNNNDNDTTPDKETETSELPAPLMNAEGAFEPGWFTRFEELQPHAATLSKFRRPEALAKSYAHLEKLKGYPDPEDAARMAEVFDLLLGDNLEGRKNHISEFGAQFLDLADIS